LPTDLGKPKELRLEFALQSNVVVTASASTLKAVSNRSC
jgi:hypothetical protein